MNLNKYLNMMEKLYEKRFGMVVSIYNKYRNICKNMSFWEDHYELDYDDDCCILVFSKNKDRYTIEILFDVDEGECTQMVFIRGKYKNVDCVVFDLRNEKCDLEVDEYGVWVYGLV